MPIYCDESGGIGTGVMTLAAVYTDDGQAEALLQRYRDITTLRGELKGSRINMTERGLLVELGRTFAVKAHICVLTRDQVGPKARESRTLDLDVYAHLLNCAIGAMLPRTGGCADVVIDDGRYDEAILEKLRSEVSERLGNWGKAQLTDSHLSSGVQIADVLANTAYNIFQPAYDESERSERMRIIMEPVLDTGLVTIEHCRMD